MATYRELFDAAEDNVLLDRIKVAIIIAADIVLNEVDTTPNHTNRVIWARTAFIDPGDQAKPFLYAVLAANKGATIATILAATDNAIQNNVNAAIDIFAGGA